MTEYTPPQKYRANMERNTNRTTLSWSKGMTTVPSDPLCGDSELAESRNFIYKDGEMRPIRKPVRMGSIEHRIMYVHKMADYEYIVSYDEDETIYLNKVVDGLITDEATQKFRVGKVHDIKSVGNTIVAATDEGLYYLLYKNTKYIDLGRKVPAPKCKITMADYQMSMEKDVVSNIGSFLNHGTWHAYYREGDDWLDEISQAPNVHKDPGIGEFGYNKTIYNNYSVKGECDTDFRNAVQGCIGAVRGKIRERNRFCFPFFVRYALRLYDGTYTKISNPILCFPSRDNYRYMPVKQGGDGYISGPTADWADCFLYMPYNVRLDITAEIENSESWKDIIEGVTVFATEEVTPWKAECKWDFVGAMDTNLKNYATFATGDSQHYEWGYSHGDWAMCVLWPTETKTDKEIMDELSEQGVYYKLCDIDLGESKGVIKDHVVSNLTTQEQLEVDDYYGWTYFGGSKLFAYNGRLNMFNLYRYPWKGFKDFVTNQDDESMIAPTRWEVRCYVHIQSATMDAWVMQESNCLTPFLDTWFYYPDPNATEVVLACINGSGGIWKRVALKKHKKLNGAYYFGRLPLYDNNTPEHDGALNEGQEDKWELPEVDATAHEEMNSQIYTSVVNNPFAFEANGDNTIGTGKILGVEANTEPISQGQFGQYPLIVFTTEGIYAMSVSSEGLYSSVHPISREVSNKNSPYVPTDSAVYFASKKGLMATSGGSALCVSEQMRGRTARNFCTEDESLEKFMEGGCLMAYDYQDSLLRIFGEGKTWQYVYNMKDGTFSTQDFGMEAKAVANDYPDNLIQTKDGDVYSLNKKDVSEDENVYEGRITTRPMKLEGSTHLKSLRAIKHLYDTDEGKVKLEAYGSNDCKHWVKLHSLCGKPWKYFTFRYELRNFRAVDSFAGSIVETQLRRDDKMR